MHGRPDWCTWWSPQEWAAFSEAVRRAAAQAGAPGTVDTTSGILTAGDGRLTLPLSRLATVCRDRSPEQWPEMVEAYLAAKLETATGAAPGGTGGGATAGLDRVRHRLRSTVFPGTYPDLRPDTCVMRRIGGGLVEVLTLSEPHGERIVRQEQAAGWGAEPAALLAIGRENLRAEQVNREELPEPGLHALHSCDGRQAASRLLLLDEEPAVGRYGCFLAAPDLYTLAYHPIEEPDCPARHGEALRVLTSMAGDPRVPDQRLSDQLFWWYAGELTAIPVVKKEHEWRAELPEAYTRAVLGGDEPPTARAEEMALLGAGLLRSGRTEEAVRWLRRAAEAGHAEAMCNLGAVLSGRGPRDEAERWLRRAVDRGYEPALSNLGHLLDDTGRGAEAAALFRRAAEQGVALGMVNLAVVLLRSGPSGEAEAERWLHRAAEQGEPLGMTELGSLLAAGGRDEEARRWFARAADAGARGDAYGPTAERLYREAAGGGDTGAMRRLAALLAADDRTANDRAAEADVWYRRAAEAGDPRAMADLALRHERAGRVDEATRWYHRAFEAGHAEAGYDLGCFLKSLGRTEEAEQWLRRAAGGGEVRAMTNLGVLLSQTGRTEEAEQWTRRGAHAGSATARSNLGDLLVARAAERRRAGVDAEADAALAAAEEEFRQAAEAGSAPAMARLGLLRERDGRVDEAAAWFGRAAAQGDQEAMRHLTALLT